MMLCQLMSSKYKVIFSYSLGPEYVGSKLLQKTSNCYYQSTWHYVTEVLNLHPCHCENLKLITVKVF